MFKALKKLLKKEKKEVKETEENILGTCPICNQPVLSSDNYKRVSQEGQEYIFHLKCFRKAKKFAKKFIKKGIIPKI